MIYSSFEGRIGNNLFQLAACLSLADKHNTKAVAGLSGNIRYMKENFLLQDIEFFNNGDPDGFRYRNTIPKEIKHVYMDCPRHYCEMFFQIPDNTFIDGFFQSEKYFKHIENKIRKNFTFNDIVIHNVPKYFNTNNDDFGFIHIRKKDYCNEDNIKIYPPVKNEYYLNCIKESNIKTIYIFSDDIEWCIENIKFIKNKKIIFVTETNPYICLYMMSQLNTAIIANSTFSWWGAWLNPNKNKKVYYPLNWYGPCIYEKAEMSLEEYIKDFICEGWIGR